MKRKYKVESIIFIIVICGIGIASAVRLVNYYLTDVVYNNNAEGVVTAQQKIENDVATTFVGKDVFINVNGAQKNLLAQKEMNGVIKMNNGYLMTPMPECSSDKIAELADNTKVFCDYLDKENIPVIFCAAPYTVDKYDTELPVGVEDYGNKNIDDLLLQLQRRDIETIDFREEFIKDGYKHYDMMYRTDHHWTTEAGFYAYNKIVDWIENKTDCGVDSSIRDIKNYDVLVYKDYVLGSKGQRTGIVFAGADDFTLIKPRFDTKIIQPDTGEAGSVTEMMMDVSALDKKDYSVNTYDAVLSKSCGHFINEKADNDIKILMISDSMSKSVNPYLAMTFRELYYVWDYDVGTAINEDFILEYNPDIVIMLYYPETIKIDSMAFDFSSFSK